MTETSEDYELFHYGVKGMQWGVRRKVGSDGLAEGSPAGKTSRAEKKVAKQDKKFEKQASSTKTFIEVHNKAAQISDNDFLPKLNAKYEAAADRGELMSDTPTYRKYVKEYEQGYVKALNQAAASMGTNASGTRKYSIATDEAGNWSVQTEEVKHALETAFKVRLKKDSKGRITGLEVIDDDISHDATSEDLELFHYGVKGMKWGVKRAVGPDGLVSKGAKTVGRGVAKGKLQDNKDMIKVHTAIRDRKSGTKGEKALRALSVPDRVLLGKKRFEKYHNKRIDRLTSQNERIESGQTTVRDKLDIALNTPMYQIYRGNR